MKCGKWPKVPYPQVGETLAWTEYGASVEHRKRYAVDGIFVGVERSDRHGWIVDGQVDPEMERRFPAAHNIRVEWNGAEDVPLTMAKVAAAVRAYRDVSGPLECIAILGHPGHVIATNGLRLTERAKTLAAELAAAFDACDKEAAP